ncbi:MAG TPA: M48 family metallopeptidase [Opitutaceae bacterium]|nr:M48 family metallopeptidase [Opitutaceae bacterium]
MKTRHVLLSVLLLGAAPAAFSFGLGDLAGKVMDKAVADPNATKGFTGLTIQEEIDIGDSVSVEIVARYGGVWKNTVATQRVNLVGRALTRYAKRDSLDWRFGLLDSDAVNAFSAPNGRVFITKGLYKLLANDDELAGVLAHEIAHVDLRHAAKIIAGKQATGAAVGLGTEIAGDQLSSKYPGISDTAKQLEEGVSKAVAGILTNGYGSDREYEADRAAYDLAKVTGFEPNGLRIALNKVEANTAHTKETFNTHPKTSDRLKKLPGGEEKKKGKGK